MADRLIHQRVFKVSKALNRLDLLCGQHRRQMESREGLPDWEKPRTPAGKASKRYETTPAFFAWDEEPKQKQQSTWQTQSPQKVARTLEMTEDAGLERSPYDISMEEIVERSVPVEDGTEEDTAIEVDSDDRSEEEQPQVVGRSITVSPAKEDILDRVTTATTTTNMMPSRSPTRPPPVEVSPSPFHSSSSPRYQHGRRLIASDAAIPNPQAQHYAAGVSTEQGDRYRMNRTSGKRLRSPARRTSVWDDLSDSYIHQSGGSSRDNPSSHHKRQALSAAERTFGGSSVFRTLNMDTESWSRSEPTRGNRQPVLTGPDAMKVASQAMREFLGGCDEEFKHSEPAVSRTRAQQSAVGDDSVRSTSTAAPTTRYRKNKKVSFGGGSNVDLSLPQPRTLPVLADKTTQTDDSLLPTRQRTRSDRTNRREDQSKDQDSPSRCAATLGESERPRKMPRGSTDSPGVQQHNFRRRSSFNHLTNPIMTNPRYPPEPSSFRGRSTYSSEFNDRLAWR